MKFIFLGSGTAFTVGAHNFQSNMIIVTDDNKKLMIDCGSDARHSLFEQGFNYQDITDVFISHLHADHMGGLEWLGFTRKFNADCERPTLYISESIVHDLWEKSLSGSMESLEGEISHLNTYFNPIAIKENETFHWEGIEFHPVQTAHVMNGFTLAPCHGLFFRANQTQVYLTADSQFCPQLLMRFYTEADIIFQDCETAVLHSGVHAHFDELITLPEAIKKKMWLYHYNPGHLPDAKDHGFLGFVKKGQVFNF
jgi:ribonuclease BN (tRNA processing enzyme)